MQASSEGHIYLSTACLHQHHDQCGKQQHDRHEDGWPRCKWCPALCACRCHLNAELDRDVEDTFDRMQKDIDQMQKDVDQMQRDLENHRRYRDVY